MKRFWMISSSIFIVLLIIFVFLYSPIFRIKNVTIEGLDFSEADKEKIIEKFKGQNLIILKKKTINTYLKEFSFIENSMIKKKYPNKLEIKIKEKEAYAKLKVNNKFFILDRDAHLIAKLENDTDKVMEFIGFAPNDTNLGETLNTKYFDHLKMALDVSELLKQAKLDKGFIKLENLELSYYINPEFNVVFDNKINIVDQFNLFMTTYEHLKSENTEKGELRVLDEETINFKPFVER